MARRCRPTQDLNLTPLRAHWLLLDVSSALGSGNGDRIQAALRSCKERLEKHVRYGLHKARKR